MGIHQTRLGPAPGGKRVRDRPDDRVPQPAEPVRHGLVAPPGTSGSGQGLGLCLHVIGSEVLQRHMAEFSLAADQDRVSPVARGVDGDDRAAARGPSQLLDLRCHEESGEPGVLTDLVDQLPVSVPQHGLGRRPRGQLLAHLSEWPCQPGQFSLQVDEVVMGVEHGRQLNAAALLGLLDCLERFPEGAVRGERLAGQAPRLGDPPLPVGPAGAAQWCGRGQRDGGVQHASGHVVLTQGVGEYAQIPPGHGPFTRRGPARCFEPRFPCLQRPAVGRHVPRPWDEVCPDQLCEDDGHVRLTIGQGVQRAPQVVERAAQLLVTRAFRLV
ncbi:hypothetical protein [Streptomyces sp. CS62]|uniref:hypothetical protein n=1 Tax=Streptomyces sp. CS62 TaxID=3119268 RepID=UPI002F934EF4